MKQTMSHPVSGRKRQGEISRAQALFLCVLCLMFASSAALAQSASPKERADEGDAARPEVKLSAHTPRICLNSTLTLVLEIINPSQQEIKIHKSELWSRFNYWSPGSEIAGSSISCGFWDNAAEDWVVLAPGAKYFDTFIYMTEGTYFKAAGTYRISTTLPYYVGDKPAGRLKSSEAEFEIYDCAAK